MFKNKRTFISFLLMLLMIVSVGLAGGSVRVVVATELNQTELKVEEVQADEEAIAKAEAEAAAKAQAEAEAAQAEADALAKAQSEAEATAQAEADALAKAQAEEEEAAKAQAEAEAAAKVQAEADAAAKVQAEAEAAAKIQAEVDAAAKVQAEEEEAAKVQAEAEAAAKVQIEEEAEAAAQAEEAAIKVSEVVKINDIEIDSKEGTAKVGDKLEYIIEVTNIGNVKLNNIKVVDTLNGVIADNVTELSPNDVQKSNKTYTVTESDAGKKLINTVSVSAKSSNETEVTSEDSVSINIISEPEPELKPGIELTKTVSKTEASPGEEVIYTFEVKNTGDVPLENIKIEPDLGFKLDRLAPGTTSKSFEVKYSVPCGKNGDKIINTAKAVGTYGEKTVESKESSTTLIIKNNANLKIEKIVKANGTAIDPKTGTAKVGDKLEYTIKVTNAGNVKLNNIKVVDTSIDELLPGQTQEFTKTYTVTANDIGKVLVDKISVSGKSACGNIKPIVDEFIIKIEKATNPKLELIYTVNKETASPGDEVVFKLKVVNNGDTPITDITVDDDIFNLKSLLPQCFKLNPGECREFELPYKVSSEDVGKLVSNAKAIGLDCDKKPVKAEATVVLNVIKTDASLSITKKVDKAEAVVGEILTYKFTIKNDGQTVINDITITDLLPGVKLTANTISSLKPGECAEVEGCYTVPKDVCEVKNIAKVSGKISCGGTVESQSNEVVTKIVEAAKPGSFKIVKTVDKQSPEKGDVVTYTIKVINTGNTDLTNVKIQDKALNYSKTIDVLKVGKMAEIKLAKKVVEEEGVKFTNVATAVADGVAECSSSVSYTVCKTKKVVTYKKVVTLPATGEDRPLLYDLMEVLSSF